MGYISPQLINLKLNFPGKKSGNFSPEIINIEPDQKQPPEVFYKKGLLKNYA